MSTLHLNGFYLELPDSTFVLNEMALPDNKVLRELRKQHEDWFINWKGGIAYAVPTTAQPRTQFGSPINATWNDHLHFLAARIDRLLPHKFPEYQAFARHPFKFLSRRDELVGIIAKRIQNPPHLLKHLSIKPQFRLEAKIIETHPNQPFLGLFLNISTRCEITAPLSELAAAGIPLEGLYLVRRKPEPGQRRSVGRIKNVNEGIALLEDAYDNLASISINEVFLEGSKTNFKRCLSILLGNQYEKFEDSRRALESDLLNGPAVQACLDKFHSFFQKDPVLQLTPSLTCKIGNQLVLRNDPTQDGSRNAPGKLCI